MRQVSSGSGIDQYKRILLKASWLILTACVVLNIIAFMHAYRFTHFSHTAIAKTKDAQRLTTAEKLKTLFCGIDNPRPENTSFPIQAYETIRLTSYQSVELWRIPAKGNAKGTVILFHGYSGHKSGLLDKADEFLKLGYHALVVDFPGSGGSAGNQTTIGFKEAVVVRDCYQYLLDSGENSIYLFGTSMGAVAIMKAIYDYALLPSGLILECPFGTMYKTTANRFHTMHVPVFPFAPLLVFWGGVQNGFWAFSHNPVTYAFKIHSPTLLLYGEQDEKVSVNEIYTIYQNLNGVKYLVTFKNAGHENYLTKYKKEWTASVSTFLSNSSEQSVKQP